MHTMPVSYACILYMRSMQYACILCMHASYETRIQCMHTAHTCHACTICKHTMDAYCACILRVHTMHAYCACRTCMHSMQSCTRVKSKAPACRESFPRQVTALMQKQICMACPSQSLRPWQYVLAHVCVGRTNLNKSGVWAEQF